VTDGPGTPEPSVPELPKLPGIGWFTPPTKSDELRGLDEELAAGRLTADDYRARRDVLVKEIMDNHGTPSGHTIN
jgi:hypothetical protein